jgi:spore germination cell wall hydrolase CwlJ-like protein
LGARTLGSWAGCILVAILLIVAGPAAAQATPPSPAGTGPGGDSGRSTLSERLGQLVSEGRSVLPEAGSGAPRAGSAERASAAPSRRHATPRRASRAPRLDLTTPPRIPASDLECLTQAIYYEARNESEEGQAAVAEVVINRSRALGYPPRVCEVVYQRNSRTCQFTFTCDGSLNRGPVNPVSWARAEAIAREVYEGRRQTILPSRSLNYHADYVRPAWASRLERVRQIGTHIFYGVSTTGSSTPGASETASEPRTSGLVFTRNSALDEAYVRAMQQPGG